MLHGLYEYHYHVQSTKDCTHTSTCTGTPLGASRSNTCASTSTRSTTLGSPGSRQSRVRKVSSCAGIEFSCPYRGRFPSAKVVFIRPSRSRALAKPQHHGQEGLGLGVTKRPRPAPLLRTTRVGTVLTHLLRFGHDPCVV